MSMFFNDIFVHILDTAIDLPILSSKPLMLNDEIEAFITSHFVSLFENHSVSIGYFTEESHYMDALTSENFNLYQFSSMLAQTLFTFMQSTTSIPSGDLIVTSFQRDGTPYLGILKLNYKEAFTHFIDQSDEGQVTTLIKHKTIFPDTTAKLQEALIINLETLECTVLNTLRQKYIHDFFGIEIALSIKEKIKVVEHVMTEVIQEHFDNNVEVLSFAKNNIVKSIESTQSIILEDVLEDTFSEYEELIETCMSECEKYGVSDKKIELPKSEKVQKQYKSHKLKTNNGIELKLPTEMLSNPDCIEFINNPDGTISILIKNIAHFTNK